MIAEVLSYYFPGWDPPRDNGREWVPCLCPAHDEDRPSAAVSYGHDAVACLACGFKGNVYSIIMKREGVPYRVAVNRAAEIANQRGGEVPQKPKRKRRRRVFGESRFS